MYREEKLTLSMESHQYRVSSQWLRISPWFSFGL